MRRAPGNGVILREPTAKTTDGEFHQQNQHPALKIPLPSTFFRLPLTALLNGAFPPFKPMRHNRPSSTAP